LGEENLNVTVSMDVIAKGIGLTVERRHILWFRKALLLPSAQRSWEEHGGGTRFSYPPGNEKVRLFNHHFFCMTDLFQVCPPVSEVHECLCNRIKWWRSCMGH
jgi:hypothetical protein